MTKIQIIKPCEGVLSKVTIPGYGTAKFYEADIPEGYNNKMQEAIFQYVYGAGRTMLSKRLELIEETIQSFEHTHLFFPMAVTAANLAYWNEHYKNDEFDNQFRDAYYKKLVVVWDCPDKRLTEFAKMMKAHDRLSYRPSSWVHGFRYSNSDNRNRGAMNRAFALHDLFIEDIQYELYGMITTVLTHDGALWVLDQTHGGGGVFTLDSRPK